MQKQISKIFFLLIIFFGIFGTAQYSYGATTSSITRHGVTFVFDEEYTYGQFANGDYWVLGPITITGITPDYAQVDGRWSNGWQVNPLPTDTYQGFQEGCTGGAFNSSLTPSLPYVASAGKSIVKTVVASPWSVSPCIKTAVVLTVLSEAPLNDGVGVFRPPYVGTSKPFFYTANIRSNLLKSLVPPEGVTVPTLEWVESQYSKLNFDHKSGWVGRDLRATDNFPSSSGGYGPQLAKHANSAILRLSLNDSAEDKNQALINFLQYTLDLYYIYMNGATYIGRNGHDGMFLPYVSFFGMMLGDSSININIQSMTNTHEKYCLYRTLETDSNVGLFGCSFFISSEANYWSYFCSDPGYNLERPDYYGGFIDGGGTTTREINSYQTITFSNYKYGALIGYLYPEIYALMNYPRYFGYVEKMVDHGLTYSPDPCAPCGSSYGVDYGPDGSGGCIKDANLAYYNSSTDFACNAGQECGRFPTRDGSQKNPEYSSYITPFLTAMWDTYHTINPDITPPSAPSGLGVQ